jgi:hypothetical protein
MYLNEVGPAGAKWIQVAQESPLAGSSELVVKYGGTTEGGKH